MEIIDIKNKIYTIREMQVMLDRDLAKLYGVETRRLNEQVRRNIEKFPNDFMFQINRKELKNLMSQNAISSLDHGGIRKMPLVFTEQGVASLSGVLKSIRAIEINIQIMRAFVGMRKFVLSNVNLFSRLDGVESKILDHDKKLEKVFDAIENNEIKQVILFDGQVFDAFKFVCELIISAKSRIILIDNYIDTNTLELFSDCNVDIIIYTSNITSKLKLTLSKYNKQYKPISIKEFSKSHDMLKNRIFLAPYESTIQTGFLIIDNIIYHFGASLKDLGKKWFAFSKMEYDIFKLLERLK